MRRITDFSRLWILAFASYIISSDIGSDHPRSGAVNL